VGINEISGNKKGSGLFINIESADGRYAGNGGISGKKMGCKAAHFKNRVAGNY